jgi:D-alanyl-D-alanine carboxypeptidase
VVYVQTRVGVHRRYGLLAIIVSGVTALGFTGCLSPSMIDRETAMEEMRAAFEKRAGEDEETLQASVLVYSEELGIDLLLRADPAAPDAFHVASVGKLLTATLVGMLIDEGIFALDQPVAPFLPPGTMDELFVVDEVDQQEAVTVRQLLSHTSGVNDYFGAPGADGRSVAEIMAEEPHRAWTPRELLDFTRNGQRAVAAPGDSYLYSDTGYILLGLLVEETTGRPFHEVLLERIFRPLGMTRSWMPGRSVPIEGGTAIRSAYIGGVDVSDAPAVTADWAGGGVASTEQDLLRFARALNEGALVTPETRAEMQVFDQRFMRGIYYGAGFMEYHFGEFFFLLRGYPRLVGHMGILGTQLFWDPRRDLYLVASFGSDDATDTSVRLLIDLLGIVLRVE